VIVANAIIWIGLGLAAMCATSADYGKGTNYKPGLAITIFCLGLGAANLCFAVFK
jgi:tellurite resistance protein TehA-like permease